MPRPTHTKRRQRFLGDEDLKVVHDLERARGACEVDEILDEGRGVRFEPDTLARGTEEGYTPCSRCTDPW